jgi:hypothetical protein
VIAYTCGFHRKNSYAELCEGFPVMTEERTQHLGDGEGGHRVRQAKEKLLGEIFGEKQWQRRKPLQPKGPKYSAWHSGLVHWIWAIH